MRALIFVGSAILALALAPVSLVAVVVAAIYGIGHQLLASRRAEVAHD